MLQANHDQAKELLTLAASGFLEREPPPRGGERSLTLTLISGNLIYC